MTDPSTRVCPRCGSAAGQTPYCGTCGLHLFEQPELPTRSDWEMRRESDPKTMEARLPMTRRRVASVAAGVGRVDRRVLSVGVLLVVVAVAFLIAGSGRQGAEGSDSSQVSDAPREPSAAEQCVNKWNTGAPEHIRLYTGYLGKKSPIYVSAGYSGDLPDRCLITLAQPDLGVGGGIARQYVETAQGSFQLSGGAGSIASLPESVKRWNARGDGRGILTLGAP